jgi:hypothetical protein
VPLRKGPSPLTDILDVDAALDAWGALEVQPPSREYRHYRPLVDAAHAFIREAQDSDRIFLGIPEFDREIRGIGKGHLCVFVGYSHSGKTLLVLQALRHNRDKRVALYIPDEPAPLVLAKLASMVSGVPAVELERRVASGDPDAISLMERVALEEFPNLVVFDKPLVPGDMERSWEEVSEVWGAPPELLVVDYVELIQSGETVQAKFDWLKAFGSRHEVPTIALHQTSRSAGADGRKMTISSGSFGGEQHATFQIGVRRKKSGLMAELIEQQEKFAKTGSDAAAEKIESIKFDLKIHEYTLTANLVKNKRPGGFTVDDIDFELEVDTGRLWPLANGDLPKQYLAKGTMG